MENLKNKRINTKYDKICNGKLSKENNIKVDNNHGCIVVVV